MRTTFAERMTVAVKESGLSLQAIADQAGTSKGQVSQWQTEGAVNPDNVKADVLEKNCVALGVRPRWLLYGELPMRPATDAESFSSSSREHHAIVGSASRLLRPDPAKVRQANLFLILQFANVNRDGFEFDLDKHAEMFSLAYQWVSDPSDKTVLAELTHSINGAISGGDGHGGSARVDEAVRRRTRQQSHDNRGAEGDSARTQDAQGQAPHGRGGAGPSEAAGKR